MTIKESFYLHCIYYLLNSSVGAQQSYYWLFSNTVVAELPELLTQTQAESFPGNEFNNSLQIDK